ncbi:Chemotaxis protein LafU [Aquimixticola soesokkakensis]|uniref:Chemotaxis protein LafU n=1 Tax=Aquimixticola soesokkakensis TaxID=1519096 RepID=A0A1Y5RFF9_9RHOB|nr:flagellar motor protein MotB [Aquimixticola soesokkakensis]SLN13601.1 Chemotaxis protein LafU [Aquimixticola soesokkakensis]
MSGKGNAPVIIKRKKVVAGDGHHGGAWKVAYADFVTAMMAFFLLMWLLNATTEKQRKGIADFFNPTIPVNRISGGGDGSFGGDSVFTEETLAQNGTGAPEGQSASNQEGSGASSGASDAQSYTEVKEMLSAFSGESMAADSALRHIVTKVTDEGLIIELHDLEDEPLFAKGSDVPEPVLELLVDMMAEVFSIVTNKVALNGFMASQPVVVARNPVWNLSSQRADRLRVMLEEAAFPASRIQRVSGYADRRPVVSNPVSFRNNRVELILLRSDISAAQN